MNGLEVAATDRYLTLNLNDNYHGMFVTDEIVEVLRIQATQILSVFNLNPYVMGVYNFRGDIIWLIDLPKLLGFPAVFEQQHCSHLSILLIELNGHRVGLGVDKVGSLWEGVPSELSTSETQQYSAVLKACATGIRKEQNSQIFFSLSCQRIFEQLKALENP